MRKITNNETTAKVNMVEIPEAELGNLQQTMSKLFMMHANLIEYYKEESELKKHHRAYLHVRDEAEKVIESDLEEMGKMLTTLGSYLVSGNSPFVEKDDIPFDCDDKPEEEDGDPCVIMKLDDLYAMQQDMIELTDMIDILAKYYIAAKYQAPINKQHYDDTVHRAKSLADEVFTKWENSTIKEIK